ncbi:thioesterase family protein [Desulfovermiculus halophilus]|jgi:predicted thioesterase|uniref:thioesterase family protein n=1 Tax=Desulfovermiculus halophilus TaxID=339722 RepID=UPI0004839A3A|nr:thioesterase family protein [Desulfovermiculus halophilus]
MDQKGTLKSGARGTAAKILQPEDLADQVGSGDLPVLATPVMAALMEKAAVDCVQKMLEEGTTSVGIRLDISHLAATPEGMEIRAQAELTGVNGKKLVFTVQAWDEAELIGQGTHERVVVSRERFMDRVRGK